MSTFVQFYCVMLGFVNFRLYHLLNLHYPPTFAVSSGNIYTLIICFPILLQQIVAIMKFDMLFILYGLFNVSSLDCIVLNDRMLNNELERYGRKWSWPNIRHNSSICLEVLRKTVRNLSEDNLSLGWDLSLRPSKCKVEALTTWPWHSLFVMLNDWISEAFVEIKCNNFISVIYEPFWLNHIIISGDMSAVLRTYFGVQFQLSTVTFWYMQFIFPHLVSSW
jgi:hypothetical protein